MRLIYNQPLNIDCGEIFKVTVEVKNFNKKGIIQVEIPKNLNCTFNQTGNTIYKKKKQFDDNVDNKLKFDISLNCTEKYYKQVRLPVKLIDLDNNVINSRKIICHLRCE